MGGTLNLTNPAAVQARLAEIEQDLAERQNRFETAAMDFFRAKRDREKAHATKLLTAPGDTVTEKKAHADKETADIGKDAEAAYEAQKAVVKVLETRASIGMSLLRSQSRGGFGG